MALTTITSGMLPADIISDHTNIGAAPAETDELLLSDAGVLKAITVDKLLDPAGYTNIGATPAGSDEVLLSDAGVLKAVTVTNLMAAAGGGGGKVLQYQFVTDNTGVDCTATGWNEMSTAVRVDLTPTHVDNLVVVFFHAGRFVKGAHNHSLGVDIYGHDGSVSSDFGAPGDNWGLASAYYNFGSGDAGPYREFTIMGIDDLSLGTPWSSGAITYKLFGRSDSAATTHQINVNDDTYWIFSAMEIDKT